MPRQARAWGYRLRMSRQYRYYPTQSWLLSMIYLILLEWRLLFWLRARSPMMWLGTCGKTLWQLPPRIWPSQLWKMIRRGNGVPRKSGRRSAEIWTPCNGISSGKPTNRNGQVKGRNRLRRALAYQISLRYHFKSLARDQQSSRCWTASWATICGSLNVR